MIKAYDNKKKMFFALKCIDVDENPEEYEVAANEVEILKKLSNCPNIVKYNDHFLEMKNDTQYFIIKMQYANCNVAEILNVRELNQEKYLFQEALFLFISIAKGILHAKTKFIAHRDIKLQNILVEISSRTYLIAD